MNSIKSISVFVLLFILLFIVVFKKKQMKSIVNNIPECRAYFEQLADDHPDLKQFQYGDAQHISKETRARIEYPCLWLETPNLRFQLVNNFTTYIDVALVILQKTDKDNTNDYRNKIDICSQIMKELLHHVKDDSEKGFVRLYNPANIQLQEIAPMDADNIIGFRAEFTLSATFSHISIADKRQNVCPIGTLPKFAWDNNTQGDFSNLTITNNTLPANAGFTWLVDMEHQ